MRHRDMRRERIRYMADLRKFIGQELGYLKNETVLDAGCGTGLVGRMIKKSHPNTTIIGIDTDESGIRVAERKAKLAHLRIKYLVGSLDAIPLAGNTLDIIVAAIVFHHIPARTRVEVLREFHRTLNKNGRLVVLEGRGLTRGLASMMHSSGFKGVKEKRFGDIRKIYIATK